MRLEMTEILPDDDSIADWERSIRFLDEKDPQVVYFRKYLGRLQIQREEQRREATQKRIRDELKALEENMPPDATKRQISDAM
jgi:hypothetical protein|tara:strand:+ start:1206 stop:1454 length:249 start_codon:yes stop_codon:yes gene_type:complete